MYLFWSLFWVGRFLTNKKYKVLADWVVAIGTMGASGVALLIAIWGFKRDERRRRDEETERRRNDSILGVAILGGLMEEIKTGQNFMRALANEITGSSFSYASSGMAGVDAGQESVPQMPVSAWEGMRTIPDHVLLRIVAISDGAKPVGFPVTEVRVHCNNYFVHICGEVNRRVRTLEWQNGHIASGKNTDGLRQILCDGPSARDGFLRSARKVFIMLAQARRLLEANARRVDPK